MKTTSYAISKDLCLVRQEVPVAQAKKMEAKISHILVVDCSGSMYGELPRIREQLKRKLPKTLAEGDVLSIVWFSGKGEFGTLLEAEPVATLKDLTTVNTMIDRWLKPMCLTGFLQPIQEVDALMGRIQQKHPGHVTSLFFVSDGHDNCSNRAEILKAVEGVAGGLAAATFVEYGYYADRPLLTAMAEKAGGSLIFARDFDTYSPAFEAAMQKKLVGGKKVEIQVPGDPVGGFVYAMQDGDLLTFAVEDGKARVSEGVTTVYSVSPTQAGTLTDSYEVDAAYAALSLFSVRMLPDVVLPFLKLTGDVAFIEKFGGLFGKQKYSEFMDAAKAAVFDDKMRLTKGFDPKLVPADDAFTVLDLLQILATEDGNEVLLNHPEFKYQRIGRARVDASENLTAAEQAEMDKLQADLVAAKGKAKGEIAAKIAALTANKQDALKFVEADADPSKGYAISNLTYNEEKPNISILVRKEGTVDVSSRLKDGEHPKVPRTFPTFVFRNYAIVKDGLVNVAKLPVKVSDATFTKLRAAGVVDGDSNQGTYVLDLSALPIINRKMVKACSAKSLFEMEWALTKARAAQKVYNTVKKERFPRKAEGFEVMYGPEAAAWLKEQGFTDYSGFGPKTVQGEARDFYMAKELSISIKGFSSIPSLNEFKKQAAKGKLTASAQLMAPAVKEIDDFLASDVYTKAKNQDKLLETWLDGQQKAATAECRRLIGEMARTRFSIVVGQVWPVEFKSIDECQLNITVDGVTLACTLNMKEVKVEI